MQNLTDEIKDLLLTRSLLLQRVSNSLTKDIINAYVSVIDDILAQIATGKNINLVNMNKIINELNAKLTPDLTSVNDDLVQLGISEASYVANGINGAIGIDLVSKLPTDRTVQKIVNTSLMDGLTLSSWLEDKDNKLKMLLKDNIQQGVIQGETIPQIVSRLKGVLTINKEGVKALAITAVATVTNQVRMQTYKENEDIFKGYEHNSTLDNRTTLLCGSRDGAFWDLEGKGLNAKGKANKFMTPPLHFRCRSLLLPITKSFKELGITLDEVPSGTRSSMDGYVSRDTTFEKWFEGKSASFQESYLGKGRYQLFKDGKITFSDLVNQNGRTLTVRELKRLDETPTIQITAKSLNAANSSLVKEVIKDVVTSEPEFDFLTFLSTAQEETVITPKTTLKTSIVSDLIIGLKSKIAILSSKEYKRNSKSVNYGENTQALTGKVKGSISSINEGKKARTLAQYQSKINMLEEFNTAIEKGSFEDITKGIIESYLDLTSNYTVIKGGDFIRDFKDVYYMNKSKIEKIVATSYDAREIAFYKELLKIR